MILARATTAQNGNTAESAEIAALRFGLAKSEEQVGQSGQHNKSKMAKGIELKIFPSFNQRHIVLMTSNGR